jgi:hypothetical protein
MTDQLSETAILQEEPPLKRLWGNLAKRNKNFTIPYEDFEVDMQDEDNFRALHGNLSKEIEGFAVPYDDFRNDMGLSKKKAQSASGPVAPIGGASSSASEPQQLAPDFTGPAPVGAYANRNDQGTAAEGTLYVEPTPEGRDNAARQNFMLAQMMEGQAASTEDDGFWATFGKSLANNLDPRKLGGNLLDYAGDMVELAGNTLGNALPLDVGASIPLQDDKISDRRADRLRAEAEANATPTSKRAKASVLDEPTNSAAWGNLLGQGAGSIVQVGAASLVGGPAAGIAAGGALSVSATKQAAREAGISDKEAAITATVLAPVVGVLEELGMGFITKNPAAAKLLQAEIIKRALAYGEGKLAKAAIVRAASELLPEMVKRVGGRAARGAAGEAVTEFAQGVAEGEAQVLADKLRGNEEAASGQGRYGTTQGQVFSQAAEGALAGAILGGAGGGFAGATQEQLQTVEATDSLAEPVPVEPVPSPALLATPEAAQAYPEPVQIVRPTGQVMFPNARVLAVSGDRAHIVGQDEQGNPVDTVVPVSYLTPTPQSDGPAVEAAPAVPVEQLIPSTEVPATEQVATPELEAAPAYGTPAENRKAGRFEKDGVTYARQAPLADTVVYGNKVSVEFASGVQQPVRYALIEASQLQPSHTGGTPNLNHFLPEAQPKNRTAAFDPASQQAVQEITAAPDANRLGTAPNAYSGAPVVNTRGEALQGNGRADGIVQHYRQGGTQYRDQIAAQAAAVGIPAEAVAQMQQPVLVRVADVSDVRARELGNYTAADTESGGQRRLEVKQAAGRLTEKGRADLTRQLTPVGDATLTETIRSNQEGVVRLLQQQGLVNPTQLQTMIGKDGNLTPAGVEDVASLYRQLLFVDGDPNLPEYYRDLPAAAQNGLDRGVASIVGLPEEASIRAEVQNAVLGVREYQRSGVDFGTWAGQADMFIGGESPGQRYSPLELKLIQLLASEKRPTYIARVFAEYAAAVKGETATLFGDTPALSRPQALQQTFQVTDNGSAQQLNTSSTADRRPTSSAARPTPSAPAAASAPAPDAANPGTNGAGGQATAGESVTPSATSKTSQQDFIQFQRDVLATPEVAEELHMQVVQQQREKLEAQIAQQAKETEKQAVQVRTTATEQALADATVQQVKERVLREAVTGQTVLPVPPQESPTYGDSNKIFTKARLAEARKAFRGQALSTVVPPELILGAGYHIEAGTRQFSAVAAKLVRDFGQRAKPHLAAAYEAARQQFLTKGGKDRGFDTPEIVAQQFANLTASEPAIQQRLKELGTTLDRVAREHAQDLTVARQSLTDRFVQEAQLSPALAQLYAAAIESKFAALVKAQRQTLIGRLLQPKVRLTGAARTALDQLTTALNLTEAPEGASAAEALIRQATNLPSVSPEQITEFRRLADVVRRAKQAKLVTIGGKQLEVVDTKARDQAVAELIQYAGKLEYVNWFEMPRSLWYAFILSNPNTHRRNLLENFKQSATELGLVSVPYNLVATGSLRGGLAPLAGYFRGQKQGLAEAAYVLGTGNQGNQSEKFGNTNQLEQRGSIWRFVGRALAAEDKLNYHPLLESRAYELATREAFRLVREQDQQRPAGQPALTHAQVRAQAFAKADEVLYRTKEARADAEAVANAEGLIVPTRADITSGKSTRKQAIEAATLRALRIDDLLWQARADLNPELKAEAKTFALRNTFNNGYEGTIGAISEWVGQLANTENTAQRILGTILVPFVRINSNVLNRRLEWGLPLLSYARAWKGGSLFTPPDSKYFQKLSNEERVKTSIRATYGAAGWLAAYAAVRAGAVVLTGVPTGNADDDREKPAQSLRIVDSWYSYKGTFLEYPLTILAAVLSYERKQDTAGKSADIADRLSVGAAASAVYLVTSSPANGPADFLSAITQSKTNPARAQSFFANLATNTAKSMVVPGFATGTMQLYNEWQNEPRPEKKSLDPVHRLTVQFLGDVPYWHGSAEPMLDVLGQPMRYNDAGEVMRDVDSQRVIDALVSSHLMPKRPTPNDDNLRLHDPATKKGLPPLTDAEFRLYMERRGKTLREYLLQVDERGAPRLEALTGQDIKEARAMRNKAVKEANRVGRQAVLEERVRNGY